MNSLVRGQTRRSSLGFWRQLLGILHKDLLLEWRSRARLNAVVFFGMLTLLLFSFAVGPNQAILTRIAPGFLWLAILLASVLSLGESMRQELDNSALEGLCLLPIDARALFLGKAGANVLLLTGLSIVLVPLSVALYGVEIKMGGMSLLTILLLGAGAISAPGTLYAAIATYARARDILLPLLLFPILIPGLLAAVKATAAVYQGDPMGELSSWVSLLVAFNIVYWLLCMLLFGRVIEP